MSASESSARRRPLWHWVALAILLAVGAAIGTAVSTTIPVTHTAETSLRVSPQQGEPHPLSESARRARSTAERYASWVRLNVGNGTWPTEGVSRTDTEVDPASATLRIRTSGTDLEAAVATADDLTERLVEVTTQATGRNEPGNALRAFRARLPQIVEADTALWVAKAELTRAEATGGSVAQATEEVARAQGRLNSLQAAQRSDAALYERLLSQPGPRMELQRLDTATSTSRDEASRALRGGALGLIGGLVCWVAFMTIRRRGPARRGGVADGISTR